MDSIVKRLNQKIVILAIILKFMIILIITQKKRVQARIQKNVLSKSLSREHFI